MVQDKNIILLKGITKRFGDFCAVDNMNLYIRKGEFVTLLGPSGCGKTTTLRMIAGFEMPDEGSVFFNGEDITGLPPYMRKVNTVFQRYALFPHLNVFNNIAFGLKLKTVEQKYTDKNGEEKSRQVKFTKDEIDKKVMRALKIVGLADYEDRDVNSLSGGQQQRVAIARAIVNEPEVLLLDEPLGALDLKMRKDMQLELKEMHKKLGITFIYVTHDQEEALTMSDTIVVMRDGTIQQIGTPTDIYNEPKNAFVADFIGESNIIDGVMKEDYLVEFDGVEVKCSDAGFQKNERVDVVIRPEDFYITDKSDKAPIFGEVISSVFKGVHYEMDVKTSNGCEFMVQDTKCRNIGDEVSLFIDADDIHIMKKMHTENNFEGVMTGNDTVSFLDGEYECDGAQLVEGAKRNEDGELIDGEGNVLNLKDTPVTVSVPFTAVDLTDYEEDAPAQGEVMTIIFKSNHYQYGVKCDNGEFIYVDTTEQWDDGDRVGISILKTDIALSKRAEETAE